MTIDHEKNSSSDMNRLQWACRRGMLELDLILGNFLKEAYPSLNKEYQGLFVQLLGESDPELFAWLLGHEEPENANTKKIVSLIREHAKNRF